MSHETQEKNLAPFPSPLNNELAQKKPIWTRIGEKAKVFSIKYKDHYPDTFFILKTESLETNLPPEFMTLPDMPRISLAREAANHVGLYGLIQQKMGGDYPAPFKVAIPHRYEEKEGEGAFVQEELPESAMMLFDIDIQEVDTVMEIGRDITKSIMWLHKHNIYHRDFKSLNIMWDPAEPKGQRLALIDFQTLVHGEGPPTLMLTDSFTPDDLIKIPMTQLKQYMRYDLYGGLISIKKMLSSIRKREISGQQSELLDRVIDQVDVNLLELNKDLNEEELGKINENLIDLFENNPQS